MMILGTWDLLTAVPEHSEIREQSCSALIAFLFASHQENHYTLLVPYHSDLPMRDNALRIGCIFSVL
jgi:hypothetical protein